MSDRAKDFLIEWTFKRDTSPISRHDAAEIAERWAAEAEENGIPADELRMAAHGEIADYLLRTFGEG